MPLQTHAGSGRVAPVVHLAAPLTSLHLIKIYTFRAFQWLPRIICYARLHINVIDWYTGAHEAAVATVALVVDWVARGRRAFHD